MEINDLDFEFFEKLLRDYLENKQITLLGMSKSLASEKGDNFFSEIYRIFLRYNSDLKCSGKIEEETMTLIIKSEITNVKKEAIHEMFVKEFRILQQVLPKVEKLMGCSIGPKLLYNNENGNFIIMEDLVSRGFKMLNRQNGLSLSQCFVAIEKIARFHAATVALTEKEPKTTKYFVEGMISGKYTQNYFRFLEVSLLNLCEGVKRWNDEECNRVVDKLKNIISTLKPRLLSMYEYDADEFCVLNHGDFWTNNIMFKNDETEDPSDSMFIDYQCSVYTSPAIDLQYFLCICPELKIKCDKDDLFLSKYLKVIENELTRMNCQTKVPTLEDLKKSIFKRRIFSIFSGLIYFPRMMCDKSDVEEFNQLLAKGETQLDIFKNSNTSKAIRKLLLTMNNRRYFD